MKTITLILVVAMCVGCVNRPSAEFIDPVTGVKTKIALGYSFAAKASGVLASASHNGTELKYSAIEEDSTEVPIAGINTAGVIAGGIILNKGEAIRETNATARHATDSKTTLGLAKEETARATFVPTVTPPAELAR